MRLRALFVVCGVALAGCDSGPTQPTSCTFALSATSATMGAAGGSGSITVSTTTQCGWTARSESAWITATGGASVTGSGTFTFSVAAATDTTTRTGALTVAGQSVSVSQQGLACAFTLLPPSRSFDAVGGTAAFDVNTTSTCTWTVGSTAVWLSVASGASGTGNGTVSYAVAANPDTASRTANLTVADRTHAVTQTGLESCTVTIGRDHDTFTVAGGSGYFEVSASSTCAWLAASHASWVRVTEPAGGFATGSRRVSYAVDASAEAATRTGTITVGGKTFVVTQAGTSTCEYSVAPIDFRECLTGGFERTVAVSTSAACGWTASAAASWITLASGQTGLGPGTIRFTFTSNYDAARQGIIEVRWPTPTAGQNVRVAQAGCLYSVSRDSVDVPAAGGDFSFDVYQTTTDINCGGPLQDACIWTAQTSASWITVLTSMPRRGDNPVSFRVAANGSATPRTAAITVRDRTVVIRQAGI